MIDELIDLITNQKLERYCKKIVESHIESPKHCFKNFILLYARLNNKGDHRLSRAVAARAMCYETSPDQSKDIVDMHLLLYFNCREEYAVEENKLKVPKKQIVELQKHSLMYLIQVTSQNNCKQFAYSFVSKKSTGRVSCIGVKSKYANDVIWELWNEILNVARTIGSNMTSYCASQLKLFKCDYDKASCKRKFGIILIVIDALYEKKKTGKDMISETPFSISKAHVECMIKINLLYRELKYIQVPTMKEYLYDIAMYK